jgi:chitin synthase
VNFTDSDILSLFQLYFGTDITKRLNALNINKNVLSWQKTCLQNLFTKVDSRQSPQCLFANDIFLVLSGPLIWLLSSVSNFWRLQAAARASEDHDKFVICQVPCYTEGDTSLRRTIDPLAQMKVGGHL